MFDRLGQFLARIIRNQVDELVFVFVCLTMLRTRWASEAASTRILVTSVN